MLPRIRTKLFVFLLAPILCVCLLVYLNPSNHPQPVRERSVSRGKTRENRPRAEAQSGHIEDEDGEDEVYDDIADVDLDDEDELNEIFTETEEEAIELFKDVDVDDVEDDLHTTPSPLDQEGEDDEEQSPWDGDNTKNVLFIMADDMRPQLEAYRGEDFPALYMDRKMYTPHLDEFAESSLVLTRAYVQYSLCGPSRTSLLTSRRPDVTRIFGNNNYWRDKGGNFTTLPQYFMEHGYVSKGYGKIFHRGKSSHGNDRKLSWSERYYMPPYTDHHYIPKEGNSAGWIAASAKDRKKVPLTDEYSMNELKKDLKDIAGDAIAGRKRFFFGLGFKKPHLSLICPEEYFHMYPLEEDEQYMPDVKWQAPSVKTTVELGEDDGATAEHLRVIPEDVIRHMRRAYFACISYVDDMFGKIMKYLDKLGLAKNTVVVFMADHGYHLGENDHWGKVSNYERATHIPLLIRVPGVTDKGVHTRALVEALDVYPTVVEAAGLGKVPECPNQSSHIRACTDGKSLLPLVENPDRKHKKVVYSQIASGGQFMSYTIRTDRYRLIDWAEVKKKQRPDGLWDIRMDWELTGWPWWTALYDRKIDPEERFNRTGDPQYRRVETKLRHKLHSFVDRLHDHPKVFVKGH